jgi:hypothetical protein
MDFEKYKDFLIPYLQLKLGNVNFNNNISCFSGNHEDKKPSMKVHSNGFKCHSCDFSGDVFDAISHFENLSDKVEQYKFAEKLFGNTVAKPSKPRFKIDKESYDIVLDYMRTIKKSGQGFINKFVKSREYTGEEGKNFADHLGFWPGYNTALKTIDIETLKKAGIPTPTEEKPYSSWHRAGVVFKFDVGFTLMFINKEGTTAKRRSHGSRSFPFPGLPTGDSINLVEAEISALGCKVFNIPNVVSIVGVNGLNKSNYETLLKFKEIIIMFDGDDPGRAATQKVIDKLLSLNYKGIIKIVDLPEDQDPDDLIKTGKVELLKKLIKEARVYGSNIIDIVDNNNITSESKEVSYKYHDLETLLEDTFFVQNALNADLKGRDDMKMMHTFFAKRPELAFQEAARLYFCHIHDNGIKRQELANDDLIWIYDKKRKHWVPMFHTVSHEPTEMFIEKYGAMWGNEGTKKGFHYKKNNTARAEIDRSFNEYVRGNIIPEQEPFSTSTVRKVISCKNCVLEWDFDSKRFKVSDHGPEHNLTVSPFPYNRLDLNQLTPDQKERKELLVKYFYGLVEWVDEEILDEKEAKKEKDNILTFLFAYIAYTLTPWREKMFMVWIGTGDSGKSTLKELIKQMHGNKFTEADLSRWNKKPSPHDNEIIPGKLVLADDDFEVGARLPERELKTLSQNGTITINPKNVKQYSVMNTSTPLILTNGLPRAEDITLENRLYALPFKSDFSRTKRSIESEQFINKIKEPETLEILFNVAIDIGEKTIFNFGNFREFTPQIMVDTSAKIISSASSVLLWIDDMAAQNKLDVDPSDKGLQIKKSDLYKMYSTNNTGPKKGLHAFYQAVLQKYPEKRSNGNDYFIGLCKIYQEPENIPYND